MQHSGVLTTERWQPLDADIHTGLTDPVQKHLPSRYLYDELGSTLFEAITLLPEYGLTRADFRLIARHAGELRRFGSPSLVIELGSGSGAKARGILEALTRDLPVVFSPIDVSPAALRQCQLALQDLASVEVCPVEATYIDGIRMALRRRKRRQSVLVLFLGSSIGNFTRNEAGEFLQSVRRQLQPGDLLLFTVDMEKDEERMIAAYDDSLGVTAAFNLNIIARLNREHGGKFDLRRFRHVTRYNRTEQRIEMHLESLTDQLVRIAGLSVPFRRGETIRTEYSYKYRNEDVQQLCDVAGFTAVARWQDAEWPLEQVLCSPSHQRTT